MIPRTRPPSLGRHTIPAETLTLDDITAIEPRILGVIAYAYRHRRRGNPWHHYERAKAAAARLCGWYAADVRLQSDDAYDIIMRRIVDALGV